MKIGELVRIVEKATGAMFCGDSNIPLPIEMQERADVDLIDRFWTDLFATYPVIENGELTEKSRHFLIEELHRISDNANSIAAQLMPTRVFLADPHASEVVILEEVSIMPSP